MDVVKLYCLVNEIIGFVPKFGTTLREKGLLFVGLDIIEDYLTAINVTSPTCSRQLDKLYGLDIAGQLLMIIEAKLKGKGN